MKRNISIITFILLTLFTACDPVTLMDDIVFDDLCTSDHPHIGTMKLAWEWPDDYSNLDEVELEKDEVVVLAVRTENMIKYGGVLQRPESMEYVDYICRTYPEEDKDANGLPYATKNTMREGYYDILSFNHLSDDSYVLGYDEFLLTNKDYFNNIFITYTRHKSMLTNDRLLRYSDITDRNAYMDDEGYRYLVPNNIDVQYAVEKNVHVKNKEVTYCVFKHFEPVSQSVTFIFELSKKEENLFVNNLRGVISGLPCKINVMTGEMPCEHTYSTPFTCPIMDSFDNKQPMRISVTVPVLGIVGPQRYVDKDENGDDKVVIDRHEMMTGPGVLQLDIQTMYRDEDGNAHVGKTLRAGINLYHTLRSNPSVTMINEKMCRQTSKKLSLLIRMPLEITHDKVIPNKSDFDNWIDVTDQIIVEV